VGYPPFYDDNQKRLEAKIKAGKYHFHEEYWHNKSPDAIDLIRKMMTVDHRKRWTAKQLLQHPWILEDSKILAQKSIIETIDTMKKFNAKRKFRAVVRSIIMIERVAKITGVKQRMSLNGRSSNAGDVPALTAAVAALDTNSPRPSDAGADSPRKSIDPATLTARVPEFVGQDLSELTESQKTARKERQSGTEMSPTSPRKSGAATSVSETQKSAVEALESTPDCSPQIDTHKSPIAPSTVVQ
jgi:serine/threonine protein kinase